MSPLLSSSVALVLYIRQADFFAHLSVREFLWHTPAAPETEKSVPKTGLYLELYIKGTTIYANVSEENRFFAQNFPRGIKEAEKYT